MANQKSKSSRQAVAISTARWNNILTLAQRTAWNVRAANILVLNKKGERIHLSGFAHYLRSNLKS